MNYNPHSIQYEAIKAKISRLEESILQRNETLDWYNNFEPGHAHAEFNEYRRNAAVLEDERHQIASVKSKCQVRVDALKMAASLGWTPASWFSSDRLKSNRELKKERQTLQSLVERDQQLSQRVHTLSGQSAAIEKELVRHRAFNPLETQAIISAERIEVDRLKSRLAEVYDQKSKLDQKLRPLLNELQQLEDRKNRLEKDLSSAQELERRLSTSPYKAAVHNECARKFDGVSSPRRVISDRLDGLRNVNRNITKLDERLKQIAQRSEHIIKNLVIDGSNLCYEGERFIGLPALQSVARGLSNSHTIVVVFDANIRRKLKMNDNEIRAEFGSGVIIHVVASEQKADEIVLNMANSDETYVISNDRFIDFPDKSAVRENRILRHEILNGEILIRDLDFQQKFQLPR